MNIHNFTSDHISIKRIKMSKKRLILLVTVIIFLGIISFFLYKTSNILTIAGSAEDVGVYKNFTIEKEKNRLDILVLGIRGSGDPNGGLLADTMVLVSFDKEKKKVAMVSLPRDLYLEMPDYPNREKINFAYALGEQRSPGGGGLVLSKEVLKYVTGVYVDYAVVLNFKGFEKIINIMGGVEIQRDVPFYESQQWQGEGREGSSFWYKKTTKVDNTEAETGNIEDEIVSKEEDGDGGGEAIGENEYWVFYVPEGFSTLLGEDALYYVRSRYSSSDFDRMRRQQQVIKSLKDKAFSLGVIANPIKVFDILDTIGNNVRTDMGLGDIREVISLSQEYSKTPVETVFLDVSEDSLLKSDIINGSYVILPKAGNFSEVRTFFQNIFE